MTSTPNENKVVHHSDQKIEQLSREALNYSVETLSDETLTDLAQVRHAALRAARADSHERTFFDKLQSYLTLGLTLPLSRVMIAAAVLITVSVNYHNTESIPALPMAMVGAKMPYEDLALLEDLEFVTWLAENQTSMDEIGT